MKPLLLKSVENKMFPYSAIEVKPETQGSLTDYHIYIEGEWHSKVPTEDEAVRQVRWLIKTYGDDWYYPSTRVNQTWTGWKQIDPQDLYKWTEAYRGQAEKEVTEA